MTEFDAVDITYYVNNASSLIERFGESFLLIKGMVTATGTPTRISGTLEGSIGIVADHTTFPRSYLSECTARDHGFEMVRR